MLDRLLMREVPAGLVLWLAQARRLAAAVGASLLFCLMVLPALADDDDEAPALPTPQAQAAAGRWTTAVLSIGIGLAVFYGVQRHGLVHSSEHPPEWAATTTRRAIVLALLAALLVWGVTYVPSLIGTKPAHAVPKAAYYLERDEGANIG